MSHISLPTTLHRNYKVIYDPELDSSPIKQSATPILEYESIVQGKAKDPRPSKVNYESKSRLYTTVFQVVDFDKKAATTENATYDHRTVLISNISPLSTESQIMTVVSVYGTVLRIEILKDPLTGGPIGVAKVSFIDEASARRAITNGNGRRVMISDSIKIEFDLKGDKLQAAFFSPVERQIVADDNSNRYSASYSRSLIATGNTDYNVNRYADINNRKKPSRWGKPVAEPIQRSYSTYQDYRTRPIYKDKRDTPPPLPSDEQKPYTKAIISRRYLPFMRGALEELERIFYPFGYIDIYHDDYDWFIIFESRSSARQAQQSIYDNNQRVIGYPIELSIPDLSTPPPQPPVGNDRLVSHYNTNTSSILDLAAVSKQILFGQLADIFLKDLKNRIAGPCIYDFLNPLLIKSSAVESSSTSAAVSTTPVTAATLESDIVTNARHQDDPTASTDNSIYKLPRFKKKSFSQPLIEPTKPTPMDIEDTEVHITTDDEQDLIPIKPTHALHNLDIISTILRPPSPPLLAVPKQRPLKRRLLGPVRQKQDKSGGGSSSSDDDFLGTVRSTGALPPKKQQAKKQSTLTHRKSFVSNRRRSTGTESNSDSSLDNEEAYRRITSRKKQKPIITKRRKSSMHARKKAPVNMVIEETPERAMEMAESPSNMEIDIESDDSMVTPIKELPIKEPAFDEAKVNKILMEAGQPDAEVEAWFTEEMPEMTLNKEWDPVYQTKDVEDLEYLRVALIEKVQQDDMDADIEQVAKLTQGLENMSQSARTRGYYPIPDSVKATYLYKNKALFDPTPIMTTTSRSNRIQNRRRLIAGMVMQNKAMADSDILKFNSLKRRKKQLKFQKSPIHEWGLYAEEHIDANEMVIEYVGEVIRQQVAEQREREYERRGIGSSYLFRVDDDTVIDATKKGSIARFINHCCAPNCSAKVITVNKQKKIIIYANRDIEPGEEITYDYKFPIEAEKIACLCGSKFCKGTLN